MTAESAHLNDLRAALAQLDRKTNEEWLASLDARKQAELRFHDLDRSAGAPDDLEHTDRQTGNKKYYTTTGASRRYVRSWIEEQARGRVFLDYACGNGDNALAAAQAGAAMAIGLDISRQSVENARRRAAAQGLTANTWFVQGDCERTGLPEDSVDAVIASGMLHHLDLSYAFFELRRIMRPGGQCLAIEALDYNPAIKLYRRLTPHMRTEWEAKHILSLREVRFAQHFFEVRNLRFWHLFSILATPLRHTSLFGRALKVADGLDRVALRVPLFQRLAWQFSFELVKRA